MLHATPINNAKYKIRLMIDKSCFRKHCEIPFANKLKRIKIKEFINMNIFKGYPCQPENAEFVLDVTIFNAMSIYGVFQNFFNRHKKIFNKKFLYCNTLN